MTIYVFEAAIFNRNLIFNRCCSMHIWEHNCNIRHETQLITARTVMTINTDKKVHTHRHTFYYMSFVHVHNKSLKSSRTINLLGCKKLHLESIDHITVCQTCASLGHKVERQFLWLISQKINFSVPLKKQIIMQFKMRLN